MWGSPCVSLHVQKSKRESQQSTGKTPNRGRAHYYTATSAILIPDFRAGCELWVFHYNQSWSNHYFFSSQRLKSLSYFGICLYYTENDTCYAQTQMRRIASSWFLRYDSTKKKKRKKVPISSGPGERRGLSLWGEGGDPCELSTGTKKCKRSVVADARGNQTSLGPKEVVLDQRNATRRGFLCSQTRGTSSLTYTLCGQSCKH